MPHCSLLWVPLCKLRCQIIKKGTHFHDETAAHLFNNSMYSACLMSPVLIMIVWKHCLSMAHNFTLVTAETHQKTRHQFVNVIITITQSFSHNMNKKFGCLIVIQIIVIIDLIVCSVPIIFSVHLIQTELQNKSLFKE